MKNTNQFSRILRLLSPAPEKKKLNCGRGLRRMVDVTAGGHANLGPYSCVVKSLKKSSSDVVRRDANRYGFAVFVPILLLLLRRYGKQPKGYGKHRDANRSVYVCVCVVRELHRFDVFHVC